MSRHPRLYNTEERQKIIDYIIQKNIYLALRGKSVWQNMEEQNICPGRTWQSMKQHFQTTIIKSLDTLNITETEKYKILYCYYKKHEFSPFNHKRLPSFCSNEDGNHENALKKSKTQSAEITISSKKINDCNRNIQQEDHVHEKNIDKSNNVPMVEDDDVEFYSSVEDPYIEEEDKKILTYITENMNWTHLNFLNEIYENCQRFVLPERSASSIKTRFLNVILPNIYKYRIVEIEDIPLFFDRAVVEIPPNFKEMVENFMNNDEVERNDIGEQTGFLVDFVPGGLCIHINNKKHVFMSNDSNEKNSKINELKKKLKTENYCIHFVNKKSYNDLLKFKELHDLLDSNILNINNKTIIDTKQLKLLSEIINKIESLQNVEEVSESSNDDELEALTNNVSKNVEKCCDMNKSAEIDVNIFSDHSSPILSMLERRKMNILNTDSVISKKICNETSTQANDHLNITRSSSSSSVHCEEISDKYLNDSVNHEDSVKEITNSVNKIDGEEINLPTLTENLIGSCSEIVHAKTISKIGIDDVVNDSSEDVIFCEEKLSQQSLDIVLADINLPKVLENLERSSEEELITVRDKIDSDDSDITVLYQKFNEDKKVLENLKQSSEEELNTVKDEIDSDDSDVTVLYQKSKEDKKINDSDNSNENKEVKAEIIPPALLDQVKYTNEEEIQIKYEPVLESDIDIVKEDVSIIELLTQQILKEESDHLKAEPVAEYESKIFETVLIYSVVENFFDVKTEEQEIDNNLLLGENLVFQLKEEDPLDISLDTDIKKIELKEEIKDEIDTAALNEKMVEPACHRII